jgi:transposase
MIARTAGKLFRERCDMATIVVIRHSPAMKADYAHHKSQGKASQVAIGACLRKFITMLNLLIKTNPLWQNKMSV